MKRRGKPSWTWNVAPPRLRQVRLAIESGREMPREMFVRLDLQRFTCFSTFRRYVTQQRAINRAGEWHAADRAEPSRCGSGGRGAPLSRAVGHARYSTAAETRPGRARRARSVRGRMGVAARRRRLAADHRGQAGRRGTPLRSMPGRPVSGQLRPDHGGAGHRRRGRQGGLLMARTGIEGSRGARGVCRACDGAIRPHNLIGVCHRTGRCLRAYQREYRRCCQSARENAEALQQRAAAVVRPSWPQVLGYFRRAHPRLTRRRRELAEVRLYAVLASYAYEARGLARRAAWGVQHGVLSGKRPPARPTPADFLRQFRPRAARIAGRISAASVRRWRRRYADGGPDGLGGLSWAEAGAGRGAVAARCVAHGPARPGRGAVGASDVARTVRGAESAPGLVRRCGLCSSGPRRFVC